MIALAVTVFALVSGLSSAVGDALQSDLDSQIKLAESAYREKQFSRAAELLANITSLNPKFDRRDYLLLLEAKARYFAGELGRSGSLFDRLIAGKGRSQFAPTCYFFEGRIAFDRRDYSAAAASFANSMSRTRDQKLREMCYANCTRLIADYLSASEQEAFLASLRRNDRDSFRSLSHEAAKLLADRGAYASAEAIIRFRYALDPETDSRIERIREMIEEKRSAQLSIALLAPISGELEDYGSQMSAAARMAVADFGDREVKLDIYDTHGSAVDAAQIARRVASEGVSVIVGPLTSQEAVGVAAYSDLMSVPVILPAASEDGLTSISSRLYQLAPSQKTTVDEVVDAASSIRKIDEAAVLAPNDDYGSSMSREFRSAADAHGIKIISEIFYPRECKDFRRFIGGMKRQLGTSKPTTVDTSEADKQWAGEDDPSRVDAVFLPANADELKLIVPQLRFYGVSARLLGCEEMGAANPVDLMSTQGYDALFPAVGLPDQSDSNWARFMRSFKKAEGSEPAPVAGLTYDAVRLAITAAKAGGLTGDGVVRGWKSLGHVDGVSGSFEFGDANQNTAVSVYLVRDGELRKVE